MKKGRRGEREKRKSGEKGRSEGKKGKMEKGRRGEERRDDG